MSREKAKALLTFYIDFNGGDPEEVESIVDEIVDAAVQESRIDAELRLTGGRVVKLERMCQQCGCTEDRACEGGCSWVDEQQDLCSRCAFDLMMGPIELTDLAQAGQMIRALRAALLNAASQIEAQGAMLAHLAGEMGGAPLDDQVVMPRREIWTP